MSAIRQRMIEDMQLHGYSAKTQTAYLGAVRGLAGHYHRTPEDITQDELRSYFLYLVKERGVARSTLTIHLCGIKNSSASAAGPPIPQILAPGMPYTRKTGSAIPRGTWPAGLGNIPDFLAPL